MDRGGNSGDRRHKGSGNKYKGVFLEHQLVSFDGSAGCTLWGNETESKFWAQR